MNPAYVELWVALRLGTDIEKCASADDLELSRASQVDQAALCDAFVKRALKLASAQFPNDLLGKEAAVVSMVQLALSLRDTHAGVGEKLASSPEETAANLEKLAYAVYTDAVISEQLVKLSGDDFTKARLTQLLGREYMVDVMRSLLA